MASVISTSSTPPESVPNYDPTNNTGREISFLHSGYSPGHNILFTLPAYDKVKNSNQRGIHASTAVLCCAIIACNAWTGRLKSGDENTDVSWAGNDNSILLGSRYFFHVDRPNSDGLKSDEVKSDGASQLAYQYPICPSFQEWLFPHADLGSRWMPEPDIRTRRANQLVVFSPLQAAVKARDWGCVMTHFVECTEVSHLVPKTEKAWFKDEEMHKYNLKRNLTEGQDIDDTRNAITLRQDLHSTFDKGYFAFVPKCGKWVSHFLQESDDFGPTYHDTTVDFHPQVSTTFLLARFAWAILPLATLFLKTNYPRTVQVRNPVPTDKPTVVKGKSGYEILETYREKVKTVGSRTGSGTSAKRKRGLDGTGVMSEVTIQGQMYKWLSSLQYGDEPTNEDINDSLSEDAVAIDSSDVPHSAEFGEDWG